MRYIIYPYKMGSNSAKQLRNAIRDEGFISLLVRRDGKYKRRPDDIVINWGNRTFPLTWDGLNMINACHRVSISTNKLKTYVKLSESECNIPEFTTVYDDAVQWLLDGETIVERNRLSGSCGEGIRIVTSEEDMNYDCPLFVKYVKKREEYRVHVFNGTVISVQMKRKRHQVSNEDVNYQVRNADNGWVFCRENVSPPECVIQQSLIAVNDLDLFFGAVDIGYNEYRNEATVYEVNTSPGLQGETIEHYKTAILNL